jgi:hypothetical protein
MLLHVNSHANPQSPDGLLFHFLADDQDVWWTQKLTAAG